MSEDFIPCTIKEAPDAISAAMQACQINPANGILTGVFNALTGLSLPREHISVMVNKFWGSKGVDLTVSFPFDNPDLALRRRILEHMNAWGTRTNVKFRETAGQGQVRIARSPGDGYWSYLGTDVLQIPANEPTMNLDSFTMQTKDSEFYRVVRHETGHTLGCPHEHLRREIVARLDVNRTIQYFRRTQGWSEQEVRQQVLTPIEEQSIRGNKVDVNSIMTYQLPGSITIDGVSITGGVDIDDSDYAFMATMFPKPDVPVPPVGFGSVLINGDAKTITVPKKQGWVLVTTD